MQPVLSQQLSQPCCKAFVTGTHDCKIFVDFKVKAFV
jgi:hypothetical protein